MGRAASRPIDAPRTDDAFGEMVWDYFEGDLSERPRYRRDDGDVTEAHLEAYFSDPGEWSASLRDLLDRLRGSVLDVGCGAGKHARYLQTRGHDVLAIDRSPGAVAVARELGVEHAAVMDMGDVGILDETVESAIALGKQIAIGDSAAALGATLTALAGAVEPGGTLLADFDSPQRRGDGYLDDHRLGEGLTYRRFRVEYADLVGPWVDLLMVEPETLAGIVEGTPWTITERIDPEPEQSGYRVVFEKG